MPRPTIPLEVIDIATPCPVDWNDMHGDEHVRFCKHCSLHVYDLSGMTRAVAERLVAESEGRLCVRLYRRADGTVITKDCEGALRLAARRVKRLATAGAALALWALLAPFGLSRAAGSQSEKCDVSDVAAVKLGQVVAPALMGKPAMPATRPAAPVLLMGAVAVQPATQPVAPATRPTEHQRPARGGESAE